MEGPSLVIAVEELKPFFKKQILKATGTAKLPFASLKKEKFVKAASWGKHLLLYFSKTKLRIHFLMFGSYRIDKPRPNRIPKMELKIGDSRIYFYSCAIKPLEKGFEKEYDWSIDLMSDKWSSAAAIRKVAGKPEALVCDVLMDQSIFAGLGNIMKNEILFNLSMHPKTKVGVLDKKRLNRLVRESHDYSWQFYEWKKANVLKRNWRIMRKQTCPKCEGKVVKEPTGKLQRLSHYCPRCQKVETSSGARA